MVQEDYNLINKVRTEKKIALQDLIFRSHEFLLIWEYTAKTSEKVICNLYQGCLFQMPLCSQAVILHKNGNPADEKTHENFLDIVFS